jgi:CRP-like cAMP-binding protein
MEETMETKTFKKGEIIFRQGDPGDCLYDILWGTVGVYSGYGTDKQRLLAELNADNTFGEMGLLEQEVRSATVVALESNTRVDVISAEDFRDFFAQRPAKVFSMMQQLSHRLRQTTKDYLNVCRTVHDTIQADDNGEERSEELSERIAEISAFYAERNQLMD